MVLVHAERIRGMASHGMAAHSWQQIKGMTGAT
jgi:hypothetical protein